MYDHSRQNAHILVVDGYLVFDECIKLLEKREVLFDIGVEDIADYRFSEFFNFLSRQILEEVVFGLLQELKSVGGMEIFQGLYKFKGTELSL